MQTLAWIGLRVVEKSLTEQKQNKKKYSKTNTSPFALTIEWRVISTIYKIYNQCKQNIYKCVSKTHIDKRVHGVQLKTMPNTPSPFLKATFPSLTACLYSTQGIENDVSPCRLPNMTQASRDLDLWPPDPRGRLFMPLPGGRFMPSCIEIGLFVFEV